MIGKEILKIKCVEMTVAIMKELESKGLIIRLCPSNHRLSVEKGEGKGNYIYESDKKFGGHSLINVSIDNMYFDSFGSHPDNEEIIFLGGENEKQMYLLIALFDNEEFFKRVNSKTISSNDFVCLKVKYNDPYVSFFTMLKNIPHGEAVKEENRLPATFYVTEPSEMPLIKSDLKDYYFEIYEE